MYENWHQKRCFVALGKPFPAFRYIFPPTGGKDAAPVGPACRQAGLLWLGCTLLQTNVFDISTLLCEYNTKYTMS